MCSELATEVVATPFGEFECFADDPFLPHLREFGTHQRSDVALFQTLVDEGDVVFDVGAFIGTMSVPLARAVGPMGRVIAFEPVAEHAELVRRNLARNGFSERAEVVQALIGHQEGGWFTSERLPMSAATTWFRPASEGQGSRVTSLDGWASTRLSEDRRLRLIKIDAEGWELDVLRGASRLLSEHRPILALEVADFQLARAGATLEDLRRLLLQIGYRLYLNVAPRDSSADTFELVKLHDLRWITGLLSDVLAAPREMELPVPIGPKWRGATTLLRYNRPRARSAVARRLPPSVRRALKGIASVSRTRS